jgi:hypothetical protein
MRHGLVLAAVLTATLGLSTTSIALAADPSPQDIAQARELGGQAQAAFDANNLAESEKLWMAANGLYPAALTLTLGLARTQAKLGKLVLATESYKRIIRENSDNPNLSPAFKDALEAAKAEVVGVSARIANVVIVVEGAPNPQVTIDGQAVSSAGLGLKRPIDPGAHLVRAEAPGYQAAETSFEVPESGLAEAKLKLEKGGAAVAGAPAAGADQGKPAEGATGKSNNKTFALVAFGVGGAGLLVGSITGLIAIGKHGKLEESCPDGKCAADGDLKKDVDSYHGMARLSTIGFIVAGVGAAAGAVLWFTAPKETAAGSTARRNTSVSWHPYLGIGGGGVAGQF